MSDRQPESAPRLRDALTLPAPERTAVIWSFFCFFSILSAYFLLRPVRDEMAIAAGPENIPNLFLGTFVAVVILVPVFGWLTKRFTRATFVPGVFIFVIANLILFYWLYGQPAIDRAWVGRAFFVWLSVVNMTVVALFWSFMTDLYSKAQARRLFGLIAAGGSAGAIAGPSLTALLAAEIGLRPLFLIAAALFGVTVVTILRLLAWARTHRRSDDTAGDSKAIGGRALDGIRFVAGDPYLRMLALLILIGTFSGTAMYLYQAEILSTHIADPEQRTRLLALMDVSINVLALLLQAGVARYAIQRLGVGPVLALLPVLSIVGFIALAIMPGVALLVAVQVARRATSFGLNGPAKETLYSVLSAAEKYKAKNVIDVTVIRGADVVSSQAVRLAQLAGMQFAAIGLACATLCVLWVGIAVSLGRRYRARYDRHDTEVPADAVITDRPPQSA